MSLTVPQFNPQGQVMRMANTAQMTVVVGGIMPQLTFGQTFDMEVDPYALVSDLNVGMRQRVEILKALKGGLKEFFLIVQKLLNLLE